MTYYSTKTYGHNIGLACVFRQPNADHSHCHLLHGYSLAFKFTFGCKELDNKNWAVDFGGLKPLKAWLEDHFDHKLALDKKNSIKWYSGTKRSNRRQEFFTKSAEGSELFLKK